MIDSSTAALIAGGAGAAGGIFGGLLSGAYQHARDWYGRPILEIDYEGREGVNKVENEYMAGGKKEEDVYIRARIRNMGCRPAQNCRIYLARLSEVKGKHLGHTVFNDAMPIAWAGWDFQPRVLPTGVDFYVDVMRVSKHTSGWKFSVAKLFASHGKSQNYVGTYRFHLLATADNATPTTFSVDVDYHKDWHNLRGWHEPGS